mmetsp:Transcript_33085/g.87471  ORF Transcript_33085/g.87471 Transcript_33085/m.87471 type:complete len:153 (-) Transcript_33085:38-496(-)
MPAWFGQTYTESQATVIAISIVLVSILALVFLLWATGIYRLSPAWGAIRKFDSDSSEDMRQRQVLIHEHARNILEGPVAQDKHYGALGRPTWGVCQSPNQGRVPVLHPKLGHVLLHEGFAETQKMRASSEWWARDEPYFMAKQGIPPPTSVL